MAASGPGGGRGIWGLLVAEGWRLWSRRTFRLTFGLVVLGIVVAAVVNGLRSSPQHPFHFSQMPEASMGVSVVLMMAGVILGATFVGGEWHHQTMTTLLTWEPRRSRVFGAKAVAGCLLVGGACAASLCLLAVAHYPVAALGGSMQGVTAATWRELAGVWLRGGLLGALGSGIGIGLAMVARSAAGSMAAYFVYTLIVEQILSGRPRLARWLILHNVVEAVLRQGGVRPWLVLAAYAAAALAGGYAAFRWRDVT